MDRLAEALWREMKSEFFSMFGISPTECEMEVRKDNWVCRDYDFDQREIRWSTLI